MAMVLAVLAAASWGSSDYAAGMASRKNSTVSVVVLTHLAAVVALLVIIADPGAVATALSDLAVTIDVRGPAAEGGAGLGARLSLPSLGAGLPRAGLSWGAAAGLSGGIGVALLYRGLARGAMVVVAPVTAAGAACVPALYGFASGEAATPGRLGGVALALVAIVVLSAGPTATDPAQGTRPGVLARVAQPGMVEALLSGVGFGGFFILLHRAPDEGLWPLVTARGTSTLLFVAIAAATGSAVLPVAGTRATVATAGVLDGVAAAFFLVAARIGLLSVVSVLASLYPAITVVLARLQEGERCSRVQLMGFAVAVAAVALLAIS